MPCAIVVISDNLLNGRLQNETMSQEHCEGYCGTEQRGKGSFFLKIVDQFVTKLIDFHKSL